jgi:hypothetical protein
VVDGVAEFGIDAVPIVIDDNAYVCLVIECGQPDPTMQTGNSLHGVLDEVLHGTTHQDAVDVQCNI